MAKQGMKRYYPDRDKNSTTPVPEISGKAKSGKVKARPLIAGAMGKVYHAVPHTETISPVYPALDNDLAVENIQDHFDMTAADLQDLAPFQGKKP